MYSRWFFGRIRRFDAEKKLLQVGIQSGTYLIRESESRPGQYSLSVRDGLEVKHYRIFNKTDTGKYNYNWSSLHTLYAMRNIAIV